MDLNKLNEAISAALETQDAYFVDLVVGTDNNFTLYADAPGGISVQKLKMINRKVEAEFDREIEDYALTVSSPGLERPLKVHAQYVNNVGRWLKVTLIDGSQFIGELKETTEDKITIEVPPQKKKEEAVTKEIAFDEIKETKIEIRF